MEVTLCRVITLWVVLIIIFGGVSWKFFSDEPWFKGVSIWLIGSAGTVAAITLGAMAVNKATGKSVLDRREGSDGKSCYGDSNDDKYKSSSSSKNDTFTQSPLLSKNSTSASASLPQNNTPALLSKNNTAQLPPRRTADVSFKSTLPQNNTSGYAHSFSTNTPRTSSQTYAIHTPHTSHAPHTNISTRNHSHSHIHKSLHSIGL